MATDILVPPLSQTMDTVVLVGWSKRVGDAVQKGETLYQVETDKATLDVESPASGILQEILVEAGTEVPVHAKIGMILAPGEQKDAAPARPVEIAHPDSQAEKIEAVQVPSSGPGLDSLPPERLKRIFSSPRARNLAKDQGLSLELIKGTGPQGMIIERDVQAALQARKESETQFQSQAVAQPPLAVVTPIGLPGKGRPVALTTLRKTIARRMQESHQTTAPVTLTREVDATPLVALREEFLAALTEANLRPTYTDFLAVMVARALRLHAEMNALFDGNALEVYDEVNLGIAVDTERGLLVPVIHAVDQKSVLAVAQERIRLVQHAQDGTLTQEESSGGTFTLTNLGALGVDGFTPILNPPQMGILGVGRIRPVPAVYVDQIKIRQVMMLSLTFDHRMVDGAPAARFLQEVTRLVEKPQLLLV